MENEAPAKKLTIMFLGDSSVGKTSLYLRYFNFEFNETLSETPSILYNRRNITYKNKKYIIELYDSPGNEIYRENIISETKPKLGYFIVYDLTNELSLKGIEYFINLIQSKNKNSKIIILANKSDLIQNKSEEDLFEKVAIEYNKKNIMCLKTSAKENKGIQQVFEIMIDLIESNLKNKNSEDKNETFMEDKNENNIGIYKIDDKNEDEIGNDNKPSKENDCCCKLC